MKEITRRLYTKPVMLAMAFLVGVGLVVGFFVTSKSRAAQFTPILHGDDKFETTGNGETFHNFNGSKIPEDFFGDGSLEYSGVVPLDGVPIPGQGDIDTIVHRNQDVWTIPGSTTLTMTALSLKSMNPIVVNYDNGTGPESWNVRVGLSAFKASTGTMTINSTTFDSTLKVWPRFTFTRIPDGKTLVLDTGDPNGPGLTAAPEWAVSSDGTTIEPVPAPTVAPCPVVSDFEPVGNVSGGATVSAATASSCAPVTLTASNVPWQPCGTGGFCIPRPLTEAELLAAHNASPPGTKKRALATKIGAVAE